MKKIKTKKKLIKKELSKKNSPKDYKSEGRNVLVGLFGLFLTIFLVQFSYKGPDEVISLNFIQVVDFFSAQIFYIINLPKVITTIFGVILLIIPFVFFYFLSKEFLRGKK